MKKFRFRKFKIYKDFRDFRTKMRTSLFSKLPDREKYCLASQLLRALNSVILNIAEGADRGSDKDFARYLNQSHTSLNEVVACLDIALDDKYINKEEHADCLKMAGELANQLTAFRKKILEDFYKK